MGCTKGHLTAEYEESKAKRGKKKVIIFRLEGGKGSLRKRAETTQKRNVTKKNFPFQDGKKKTGLSEKGNFLLFRQGLREHMGQKKKSLVEGD